MQTPIKTDSSVKTELATALLETLRVLREDEGYRAYNPVVTAARTALRAYIGEHDAETELASKIDRLTSNHEL